MKNAVITEIKQRMTPYLNDFQIDQLTDVLEVCLQEYLAEADPVKQPDIIQTFLAAKRVEGCSNKTLTYYDSTIRNVLKSTGKPVQGITTDDLRIYLDSYQTNNGVSKVTIDNIRRILSTFFAWLEDENFIIKSPVRRIHKVKTCKTVKETYSDEFLEIMRDNAESIRDLAMIDLLASTGIRVGELVLINRVDVDFVNRECIVLGKGNKQRKVYFDARTKIHLQRYLSERTDDNSALFVTLHKPYSRLQIKGVEMRLQRLGRKLGLIRVHPHKFRRTLATMAIDKGMPIEQVQQLLGHESVDTTLQYAMVNQNNVKLSHHRYIG